MKIHEYQGKQLFQKYGVPVPIGIPAMSAEEAIAAIPKVQQQAGTDVVVVKAQIHAGGRGKGGGVKVAKNKADAEAAVKAIWNMQLVTHQTGPEGKKVQRLLVEQGLAIDHEYYLGMLLDRATGRVTVMASTEGGMDIEEVAAKHPEKILREAIDPATGWQDWQGRKLAKALGITGAQATSFAKFMKPLVRAYDELDCSLLEINPLITTKDGKVLALDAKVNFDDNAMYRHPELEEMRIRTKRIRRSSRRRSTTSATSSSTATSAAWSTAPVSRCRRWTSSTSTVARRRTSWTSAVAPRPRRSPRRSRSSRTRQR
ncbi:MAG: acetate--CoA ligase family protein [Kofleriaceae bacterium]